MKTIVITGVTRGLGAALVDEFVEAGHRVLGCGRNRKRVDELNATIGGPHDFAVVDVADVKQVDEWAHRLCAEHGAPDLVINNAALINANAPLWQVPADDFSRVVDVNIKGVYHVIRAFIPAMIERGRGVMVNLSSGWGRSTSPDVAAYCATKWAVEGMTRALSQELPRSVAAVSLNPGVINTEMLQSCFGAGAASCRSPKQWAKTAAPFLLGLDTSNNGDALTAP